MEKLLMIACFFLKFFVINADPKQVFCYYDSKSFNRDSNGKMSNIELEGAVSYCTHIIYGYAGIDHQNNKIISLSDNLDLDQGIGYFRTISNIKKAYPKLKVLLSVGGGADPEPDGVYKYNKILETPESRTTFINSAVAMLKDHSFDGLDLAWQFPTVKPKKNRSKLSSFFHKLKKVIHNRPIDNRALEHRDEFVRLTIEAKSALAKENMMLTVSVLPNVNNTLYFDTYALKNVDVNNVILHAYDFYTPKRNPHEADYAAPIYGLQDREPHGNIDYIVNYWLNNEFPHNKLILAIPTFARTWKLTSDSAVSGVPPISADGGAAAGKFSNHEGMLSYTETCQRLKYPSGPKEELHKVIDKTKKYGTYAYRNADNDGNNGIWISYEDPESAAEKARYVTAKDLGGLAIVDLSLDDFRGLCTMEKFPILRAAQTAL